MHFIVTKMRLGRIKKCILAEENHLILVIFQTTVYAKHLYMLISKIQTIETGYGRCAICIVTVISCFLYI